MAKQLVIQLARFGDIVQTKRLILSLRRTGEVHLCVDRSLGELARLIYPDIPVHVVRAHGGSALEVVSETRQALDIFRAERFDTVYALNHAGLCRALASFFEPAIVRGYPVASGQPLRSNWIRLAFRWMGRRTEAPLNLVDFWAALADDMVPPQSVNPEAVPRGGGLGVVLAGRNARRSLPPDMLAPVVHAAFARLGGPSVCLLGGEEDRGSARRLLAAVPRMVADKTVDLTGRTDWKGLAGALADLDLLLTPDTGTAHLAAHMGVPVEGLYCSSAWALETGPYGAGHHVWQTLPPCAPCTESSPCGRNAVCREAFRTAPFLSRMQGRSGGAAARPLEGMALLRSDFDSLGLIWNEEEGSGLLPAGRARLGLRRLLGEYRGTAAGSSPSSAERDGPRGIPASPCPGQAENLYQEADWMLPRILP